MIASLSLLLLIWFVAKVLDRLIVSYADRRLVNVREQVAREHGYSVTQHRDARGNYDLSFPPMQIAG